MTPTELREKLGTVKWAEIDLNEKDRKTRQEMREFWYATGLPLKYLLNTLPDESLMGLWAKYVMERLNDLGVSGRDN